LYEVVRVGHDNIRTVFKSRHLYSEMADQKAIFQITESRKTKYDMKVYHHK